MRERNKPGVMIYFDDFASADEEMTDEQMGRYIRAIVHYAKDGEWQSFDDDLLLRYAFKGAKPKIDRDSEVYEKKKLHGQYMAYVRVSKENKIEYLSEQEWIEQHAATNSCNQLLQDTESDCTLPITIASPITMTNTIAEGMGCKGKGEFANDRPF